MKKIRRKKSFGGFSPPRSQGELETHDFKKLLDPNTIGELGPTVALSVSYLEFERTEKNMNGFALGITDPFSGKNCQVRIGLGLTTQRRACGL